jgi:hypothetical protein
MGHSFAFFRLSTENTMGHRSACRMSTRGSKLWGTALHVDCLQEGVNYGAQLFMSAVYKREKTMGHRSACRLSTKLSKLWGTGGMKTVYKRE